MNDDELRRRLDALAAHAPDGEVLRERWEAAARTRRTGVVSRGVAPVAAVLAAAAVLVVAGVGLSGLGGGEQGQVPEATAPAATDDPQTDSSRVADGGGDLAEVLGVPGTPLREVGRGRVVVSVPQTWRWEAPRCDEPLHDSYYFTIGVFRACLHGRSPTVTTVRIDSLTAARYDERDPAITDGSLDGVAYGHERTSVDGITQDVVVVPEEDVRLVVRGPLDAVDALVRSLRLLPAGQVTVPQLTLSVSGGARGYAAPADLDEMRARLERVGLEAEFRTLDNATRVDYGAVNVSPAPGAVVDVGSRVRVELAGG
jgi:hypothetical protein